MEVKDADREKRDKEASEALKKSIAELESETKKTTALTAEYIRSIRKQQESSKLCRKKSSSRD